MASDRLPARPHQPTRVITLYWAISTLLMSGLSLMRSGISQLGVILGLGAITLAFTRPAAIALAITTARSLSDVGSAGGTPVLPSGALSAALAVGAVALLVIRYGYRAAQEWAGPLALFAITLAISLVVAVTTFGQDARIFREAVRLASIGSLFVYSWFAFERLSPRHAAKGLSLSLLPAGALTVLALFVPGPQLVGLDGRAAGPFSHPNSAAAFLALGTIFALSAALRYRTVWAWVSLSVLSAGLFATQSLSSLAAASLGATVLIGSSRSISIGKKVSLGVVAGAAAVTLAVFTGASNRLDELGSTQGLATAAQGGTTNSVDWRFYNWTLLLNQWRLHPWLGFGTGATSTFIQPAGNLPHSVPIQLLVEYGLLGCTLIVIFLLACWLKVRATAVQCMGTRMHVIAVILVAVVNALGSNFLGYTAAMYLLAVVIPVMCAGHNALETSPPLQSRPGLGRSERE